jgi:hypothetical protein
VLYVMAAIMAAAAVVAMIGLERGVQEEVDPAAAGAGDGPAPDPVSVAG